ncbi:MAG: gamma-glutamylcyclotransferase [Acidimicrobiia bacterium]|nr:gamma-glutamylcyclotransferase [Acidimicrobiia bacterium]
MLFVYGTLQPGRLRWPFLAPYVVGAARPATVPGALYDTGGGWPIAVFGAAGAVPGTLVRLDPNRLGEALTVLDEIEVTATASLRRIVVTTTDGESAWAYHWVDAVDGFVPIDRWTSRDER